MTIDRFSGGGGAKKVSDVSPAKQAAAGIYSC
jgi:hypothetical protein